MLAHLVKRDRTAPTSIKRLVHYITDPQRIEDRVKAVRVINLSDGEADRVSVRMAIAQMEVAQSMAGHRAKQKTGHVVLSFVERDLDESLVWKIEAELMERVGYGSHQRVSVIHGDRPNRHVHIAFNKVSRHPDAANGKQRWLNDHFKHDALKLATAVDYLQRKYHVLRTDLAWSGTSAQHKALVSYLRDGLADIGAASGVDIRRQAHELGCEVKQNSKGGLDFHHVATGLQVDAERVKKGISVTMDGAYEQIERPFQRANALIEALRELREEMRDAQTYVELQDIAAKAGAEVHAGNYGLLFVVDGLNGQVVVSEYELATTGDDLISSQPALQEDNDRAHGSPDGVVMPGPEVVESIEGKYELHHELRAFLAHVRDVDAALPEGDGIEHLYGFQPGPARYTFVAGDERLTMRKDEYGRLVLCGKEGYECLLSEVDPELERAWIEHEADRDPAKGYTQLTEEQRVELRAQGAALRSKAPMDAQFDVVSSDMTKGQTIGEGAAPEEPAIDGDKVSEASAEVAAGDSAEAQAQQESERQAQEQAEREHREREERESQARQEQEAREAKERRERERAARKRFDRAATYLTERERRKELQAQHKAVKAPLWREYEEQAHGALQEIEKRGLTGDVKAAKEVAEKWGLELYATKAGTFAAYHNGASGLFPIGAAVRPGRDLPKAPEAAYPAQLETLEKEIKRTHRTQKKLVEGCATDQERDQLAADIVAIRRELRDGGSIADAASRLVEEAAERAPEPAPEPAEAKEVDPLEHVRPVNERIELPAEPAEAAPDTDAKPAPEPAEVNEEKASVAEEVDEKPKLAKHGWGINEDLKAAEDLEHAADQRLKAADEQTRSAANREIAAENLERAAERRGKAKPTNGGPSKFAAVSAFVADPQSINTGRRVSKAEALSSLMQHRPVSTTPVKPSRGKKR